MRRRGVLGARMIIGSGVALAMRLQRYQGVRFRFDAPDICAGGARHIYKLTLGCLPFRFYCVIQIWLQVPRTRVEIIGQHHLVPLDLAPRGAGWGH